MTRESELRWMAGLLGVVGELDPAVLKRVIIETEVTEHFVHWSLVIETKDGFSCETFKDAWLRITALEVCRG